MTEATQAQLIEAIFGALPHPHLISSLVLDEDGAVRFKWRQQRFRAQLSGNVETVQGSFLVGDDPAILAGGLLRRELIAVLCRAEAGDAS